MNTKKKLTAIDRFLNSGQYQEQGINNNSKKQILSQREGLIERVDKVLVTRDGKQLLREQY